MGADPEPPASESLHELPDPDRAIERAVFRVLYSPLKLVAALIFGDGFLRGSWIGVVSGLMLFTALEGFKLSYEED